MTKRYYLTTPIYYVNDDPHIGHAYTTLACDVLARFKRLDGYDVKLLTGTDEHGQKVAKSAADAGVDPKIFTDRVSQNFRDLSGLMNFSHDDFIRTTEDRHKRACQDIWKRLVDNDEIYLDSYAGWYAIRDEAFYTEDELTAGPDGKKIAPSGAEVEWVEEPSYFFRLSAWQDRLLEFYDANPDFVLPKTRLNEVTSFVSGGLRDLSVYQLFDGHGGPLALIAPDRILRLFVAGPGFTGVRSVAVAHDAVQRDLDRRMLVFTQIIIRSGVYGYNFSGDFFHLIPQRCQADSLIVTHTAILVDS